MSPLGPNYLCLLPFFCSPCIGRSMKNAWTCNVRCSGESRLNCCRGRTDSWTQFDGVVAGRNTRGSTDSYKVIGVAWPRHMHCGFAAATRIARIRQSCICRVQVSCPTHRHTRDMCSQIHSTAVLQSVYCRSTLHCIGSSLTHVRRHQVGTTN